MQHIAQNLLNKLGKKTLHNALKGEHIETRALATQKIGRTLREISLSDDDREFAEKILTLICRDVSDVVRRALSVTLQNSPNLPPKIAQMLIADIDSVAAPILKSSPVITDADLVDILKSKAANKVKAIAQRQRLSAHISRAIVSYGDSAAVAELAANDSALISPDTAETMVAIYADDDLIRDAALSRADMPPATVQTLINASARKIEAKLERRGDLTQLQASDIANRTQQRALVTYVDQDWPEKTVAAYINTLHQRGGLSEDILLRAAGLGDIRFVQIAMATLTGIKVQKAGIMMFDGGPLGFPALCKRAGLGQAAQAFLAAALAIYRDFQLSGQTMTDKQMQKLMIERVLTLPVELTPEVEAAFCEKLDSLSHLAAVS